LFGLDRPRIARLSGESAAMTGRSAPRPLATTYSLAALVFRSHGTGEPDASVETLARRGVPVYGIDLSGTMVARLRAKPGGDAIGVKIGDFATTRVDGTFSVAYLVFDTIMSLTTQAARWAWEKPTGNLQSVIRSCHVPRAVAGRPLMPCSPP
jgi:hypothetical protein